MNHTLRRRIAVSAGLAGLLAGVSLSACARADARGRPEVPGASSLLGTVLPAVTLRSVGGSEVALADRLVSGPTLVIILGTRDCLSCLSYRLELAILAAKLPGVSPVLIGSGAGQDEFRDYFLKDRLDGVALLDAKGALLAALHVEAAPLVLLVDSAGVILFVDDRGSSAAAQFPFGRLLPRLGGALQPVSSSAPKSGGSN